VSKRLVLLRRTAIVVVLVVLSGVVLGIAFAGSPARLASGVRIAGVDVGGRSPGAAKALRRQKWARLEHVPVSFNAGGDVWRLSPSQLGVRPDWGAAVDDARHQGQGFGPLRGFRRLDVRVFGADVAPPTSVYDTALEYVLNRIARKVDTQREEASVVLQGLRPRVVAGHAGRSLDRRTAAETIVRALASLSRQPVELPLQRDVPHVQPEDLTALVAETTHADRTTKDAQAMRISGLVASYETFYGGDPNRIHNVQLVAHLIDDHVIAPGATFSFNEATGARTEDKGFKEAPVIINGELKTGLGGGVCQVSTTVFNTAYEAGLPIAARTNHALYISHYPQGRDATVNYPDVDLKFVNDTGHWLLLRTWVGSSSLTVALYGTPVHRRVVSDVAPLKVTGAPPVQRVLDPSLTAGEKVVEDSGEPSRSTSVRRRVYDADGKLLYDTVFYSSYRSEPAIVRVGPKPSPAPAKPKKKQPKTTTTTTTTTPITTAP